MAVLPFKDTVFSLVLSKKHFLKSDQKALNFKGLFRSELLMNNFELL